MPPVPASWTASTTSAEFVLDLYLEVHARRVGAREPHSSQSAGLLDLDLGDAATTRI